MYFLKLKELWILPVLILLAAARPWKTVDNALGLQPPVDSLVAGLDQDSLLMQPVNIVLPPSAVDTLERRIALKDSIRQAKEAQLRLFDKTIAENDKKLSLKKKAIQKQEENLVSLEEIYDMYDKQASRKGKGEFP